MDISPSERRATLVLRGSKDQAEVRNSSHNAGVGYGHKVLEYLPRHPELVRRTTTFHAADLVPYGEGEGHGVHLKIPPDIEDALGQPFTPPAPNKIDDVVEEYGRYQETCTQLAPPWDTEFDETASKNLKASLAEAEKIDPEVWHEYRDVHRRQQDRAARGRGVCTLMRNARAQARQNNLKFNKEHGLFDTLNLRHYKYFLLGANSSTSLITSLMRVPVGDYGVRWALKILRAANFMVDFAEQDPRLLWNMVRLVKPRRKIVSERTLRARDGWGPEHGNVVNLQEGIQSMFSTTIMHTAERIPWLEQEPTRAFERVCASDLPNQTTLHAGLAFVFPMMVHGVTLPKPNEWSPDGHLQLTDRCVESMTRMREITEKLQFEALCEYDRRFRVGDPDAHPPVRTGLPCTFAGGFRLDDEFVEGLITQLTPVMLGVMKMIDTIDDSPTLPPGRGMPAELPDLFSDSGAPPTRSLIQRVSALCEAGIIPQVPTLYSEIPTDSSGYKPNRPLR